jgi:N-acetylmuramoyl-L-alanine amidase
MKIGINPEHYQFTKGKRSPTIPPGIYEWEFNIRVAMLMSEMLQEAGHEVVRTIEMGAKEAVSLTERRRILMDCDLSITIAANASGDSGWSQASGFCVFHKAMGEALAVQIAKAYSKQIPEIRTRFGGIQRRAYAVIPYSSPSALIECGFMTNKSEASFLAAPENQQRIARAIAEGVLAYIERTSK